MLNENEMDKIEQQMKKTKQKNCWAEKEVDFWLMRMTQNVR